MVIIKDTLTNAHRKTYATDSNTALLCELSFHCLNLYLSVSDIRNLLYENTGTTKMHSNKLPFSSGKAKANVCTIKASTLVELRRDSHNNCPTIPPLYQHHTAVYQNISKE